MRTNGNVWRSAVLVGALAFTAGMTAHLWAPQPGETATPVAPCENAQAVECMAWDETAEPGLSHWQYVWPDGSRSLMDAGLWAYLAPCQDETGEDAECILILPQAGEE